MKFDPPLLPGRLVRRYKRFLADVVLDVGRELTVHCPNPGSMKSLVREGARVCVADSMNPKRKLRYTWELVRVGRHWAGVNTMRTNRIVQEALEKKRVPELADWGTIRPEAPMGEKRRVDFLLSEGDRRCYVEVKNVSLAEGGVARFPDSVTTRGRAHLVELRREVEEGNRAVMLYLVNRGDCATAGPADDIDPEYGETLREAAAAGVETLAYRAKVGTREIRLAERIPFVV